MGHVAKTVVVETLEQIHAREVIIFLKPANRFAETFEELRAIIFSGNRREGKDNPDRLRAVFEAQLDIIFEDLNILIDGVGRQGGRVAFPISHGFNGKIICKLRL